MTPKHRNMKARNEYTARRVPELIAQWQWDHADEWERAKAEGWSGDLMQELRKLAWAVAHREYDQDAEGEYRVTFPAELEAIVKARWESCRALWERHERIATTAEAAPAEPLPPLAQEGAGEGPSRSREALNTGGAEDAGWLE